MTTLADILRAIGTARSIHPPYCALAWPWSGAGLNAARNQALTDLGEVFAACGISDHGEPRWVALDNSDRLRPHVGNSSRVLIAYVPVDEGDIHRYRTQVAAWPSSSACAAPAATRAASAPTASAPAAAQPQPAAAAAPCPSASPTAGARPAATLNRKAKP